MIQSVNFKYNRCAYKFASFNKLVHYRALEWMPNPEELVFHKLMDSCLDEFMKWNGSTFKKEGRKQLLFF